MLDFFGEAAFFAGSASTDAGFLDDARLLDDALFLDDPRFQRRWPNLVERHSRDSTAACRTAPLREARAIG